MTASLAYRSGLPAATATAGAGDEQDVWIERLRGLLGAIPAFTRGNGSIDQVLKGYLPGSPFVNVAREPAREAWLLCCALLEGAELRAALEYLSGLPSLTDSQGRPLLRSLGRLASAQRDR